MAENGDSEEFTFTAGEDGYQDDADLNLGADDTEAVLGTTEGGEGEPGEVTEQNEPGEVTEDPATETGVEDPELEAIKARVREMEEEAEKLKEMQSEVEKQMNLSASSISSPPKFPTVEEKVDIDTRSIYVGNVDYGATAEELEAHFHGCGSINRVTILCDKFTGHPKGFAYVEFADKDSIVTAQALDDSLFRGRQIKVTPKRTNKPGISTTDRPPRGRGRGRFARGASAYTPPYYSAYGTGYAPRPRGRFRPRRAMYYSPY